MRGDFRITWCRPVFIWGHRCACGSSGTVQRGASRTPPTSEGPSWIHQWPWRCVRQVLPGTPSCPVLHAPGRLGLGAMTATQSGRLLHRASEWPAPSARSPTPGLCRLVMRDEPGENLTDWPSPSTSDAGTCVRVASGRGHRRFRCLSTSVGHRYRGRSRPRSAAPEGDRERPCVDPLCP